LDYDWKGKKGDFWEDYRLIIIIIKSLGWVELKGKFEILKLEEWKLIILIFDEGQKLNLMLLESFDVKMENFDGKRKEFISYENNFV